MPSQRNDSLWLHSGTGQWAKKVDGQTLYFGTDRAKAEARYKAFLEGPSQGKQVRDLLNSFHEMKKDAVDSGEITQASYDRYITVLDRIAESLGKHREIASLDVRALPSAIVRGSTLRCFRPKTES